MLIMKRKIPKVRKIIVYNETMIVTLIIQNSIMVMITIMIMI